MGVLLMTTEQEKTCKRWPKLKNRHPLNKKSTALWSDFLKAFDNFGKYLVESTNILKDKNLGDDKKVQLGRALNEKEIVIKKYCVKLHGSLENSPTPEIQKLESYQDFFFDSFTKGHYSCIEKLSIDDQLRPISQDNLNRQIIFDLLLNEIGLYLFIYGFRNYRNTEKNVTTSITTNASDGSETRTSTRILNHSKLQVESAHRCLFDTLASLSEIVAYYFTDAEDNKIDEMDLKTLRSLKNVTKEKIKHLKINNPCLSVKMKELLPDVDDEPVQLLHIIETYEQHVDSIEEVLNWRLQTEKAIDLGLRFYIFDETKNPNSDETLLRELIRGSISTIESQGFTPYKNYKDHLRPILRQDEKYKFSSNPKHTFYWNDLYTRRNHDKKKTPTTSKYMTSEDDPALKGPLPKGKSQKPS